MSVLHLRRDMVVVKKEPDPAPDPAVEIEKPFPLRKIEEDPADDVIEAEAEEISEHHDHDEAHPPGGFMRAVRFWFNAALLVAILGAYPTLVVMSSNVGDGNISGMVDRSKWSIPWTGGASTLMEKHFDELGWASDAPSWAPMARLTAKPAFQSAMAGAIGEFVTLENAQANASRQDDPDLAAAARLVSKDSTSVQLRAARDALTSYDRRLHRRAATVATTPAQLAEQLKLVETWAMKSQSEIAAAAATAGNSPIDAATTKAVYAAKGRAMAAYVFLDTMIWPQAPRAAEARAAAMDAWKVAAEFHPMIVLSGKADGSVFGNHAVSMGFLVARAQKATDDFLVTLATAPAVSPASPAASSATMASAVPGALAK
ncbi:MAG TPA: hypothetical protein VG942_03505 [Hyphomonadaceae bacterium]|nr:hypothetical protein [Hyphomonadaceae bacterium]